MIFRGDSELMKLFNFALFPVLIRETGLLIGFNDEAGLETGLSIIVTV